MHDEHQCAARDDSLVLDLEGDRHDLFQRASDPASGAEGLIPTEHHQATAHLLDVDRQLLLSRLRKGSRGHVGQDDRGIVQHMDQAELSQVRGGHHVHQHVFTS